MPSRTRPSRLITLPAPVRGETTPELPSVRGRTIASGALPPEVPVERGTERGWTDPPGVRLIAFVSLLGVTALYRGPYGLLQAVLPVLPVEPGRWMVPVEPGRGMLVNELPLPDDGDGFCRTIVRGVLFGLGVTALGDREMDCGADRVIVDEPELELRGATELELRGAIEPELRGV